MTEYISSSASLSHEFLAKLLLDLDDDTVTAIILHGSYARGDAHPPYSDVDLVRITKETPDQKQQKKFIWYEAHLLNLSSRPLSVYKKWLTLPQEAIFRISTIRDAQILLEHDDAFRRFQQDILKNWKWEPLQEAANVYASTLIVELSEVILRTLGALQFHHTTMLVERILLHILPAVTEAIGVQRGIIAHSNIYLSQVQEAVGINSIWTRSYRDATGEESLGTSIEKRGIAALRLYRETIRLLQPSLVPDHLATIKILMRMVDQRLEKEIS